jgi:hypothetical protein
MNQNSNLNWESIIKLDRENIEANKIIIHGVFFELNEDLITLLQQKNFPLIRINLPESIIKEWQDYLINFSLISGIKFTSYYPFNNAQKPILETNIYPDGKILTYITQNFLENSNLVPQISLTHYWLISQLMLYPIQIKNSQTKKKSQLIIIIIFFFILLKIILWII